VRPVRPDSTNAHGDRGAALILALVLVGVVSVVVAALLALVIGNLKTTQVAQARTTQRYAADAAVEGAIEALRNDRTLCSQTASQPLPQLDVDGIAVSVDCTGATGTPPGAAGWTIVTTATDQAGLTTSGPVTVQGGVWSARLANSYDPLTVDGGNLVERRGAATCTTDANRPNGVTVQPDPPYHYRCADQTAPTVPAALPTTAPPAAPAPVTVGTCKVFRPGTYTAAPAFGTDNLLVSGTYYFHDVAPVRVPTGATVIGGERADEDRVNAGSSACDVVPDTLADGTAAPGTGVKLLLGGTSWLEVQSGTSIELQKRVGGASSEGQMGISLQAVTAPAPAGMTANSRGLTNPLVSVIAGGQLTVHGLVHAPSSYVSHHAKSSTDAELRGGVLVGRLHLASGGGGLVVSS
jgi:hypothetical protein